MSRRALISVFDKTGIVEFTKELIKNGYEIISTSGTAKLLKENNILFRMAEGALSETDNQVLLKQFEEAEKNHSSGSSSEDYIERIKHLASAYGVEKI